MAVRAYFAVLSLAILVLCIVNYWIELTPSWKAYQKEYYGLLAEHIDDGPKAEAARNTPTQFVQVYNPELGVVDRCTICHLGMESPLMAGAPNPHKPHPGDLLVSHAYQNVGCTICHQGQPLATSVEEAHGHAPHWEQPLLTGDFIQATCTKCHHEDEVPQAPVLTRGRTLLRELGCIACHETGGIEAAEKVGPRLDAIGSKVSLKWLRQWLADPKRYLPKGRMPHYDMSPTEVSALVAYLSTFKDDDIDRLPEPEGDYEVGATVYREAQCIVCHVTRLDFNDDPVGGTIGPDLLRLGNKVSPRWLVAFLKDPHAFLPNTKMPRYHFTDQEIADLTQFAVEEWFDFDWADEEEQQPDPTVTVDLIEQGRLLYAEMGCAGCHDLTGTKTASVGPDLSFIGSKPVHDLDFGDAAIRHTLPDFLYTKLRSPGALKSDYRLPLGDDPAAAIWNNLRPAALFASSEQLPEGSVDERLAWILGKVQQKGLLDAGLTMPGAPSENQAVWLVRKLNVVGALSPLKMPDFRLSEADAESLTIALLSLSEVRISSRRYEVPRKQKVFFNPKDEFGTLERRYRCLSCHSIRGSGDPLASDLTLEGNRVNQEWLYHYLKTPYSMRRTLTIAMPIFRLPDDEARFMAEYMSRVFVDGQMGIDWIERQGETDAERGQALFDAKGCIACHQVHGTGGDVGPSLTTQVPEFPHGTWVGDKLKGAWIYEWLKDPQALVPDTLEPNLGLTDEEALDLTAYILSLKNPEFGGQE